MACDKKDVANNGRISGVMICEFLIDLRDYCVSAYIPTLKTGFLIQDGYILCSEKAFNKKYFEGRSTVKP